MSFWRCVSFTGQVVIVWAATVCDAQDLAHDFFACAPMRVLEIGDIDR